MARRPPKIPKTIGLRQEPEPFVRGRSRSPRDPRQPQLPFDPMPGRVEPALALLASVPPTGSDWAFEIKWDGYRLAVHVEPNGVRILTRGGHDWTHRFPSIAEAAKGLDVSTVILDGEAVILDAQGRSDFSALQRSLGGRGGKRVTGGEVLFYAFDLLYLDGHDVSGMALDERRHLLADLLRVRTGAIHLSEEVAADGAEMLRLACEHGLEGIIAKHRDRPYRSGRRGDWLKIKCVQSETFAIIGYEPSTKVRGAIASLLVAARKGGELVFVGGVGTGFKTVEARSLKRKLDEMTVDRPAYAPKGKQFVFVRPELVAEIEYRGWTSDGSLRHASFKGLREPEDRATVFQMEA